MTDYRTLLPIANQAVDIGRDLMFTMRPGVLTAKGDRDMASEVDFAIENRLRDFLAHHTPNIAFLGEEMGETNGEPGGLMWALDPVDGTVNFVHGSPLCAISLGLIAANRSVLGVIDLPFLGGRYTAADGAGAHLDGRPISVSGVKDISEAVVALGDYAVGEGSAEKNRLRYAMTQRLTPKVQRVRMHGSAAIDLAWLAAGKVDATAMLSNKPWDTSAGVVIAREAGAVTVDLDGSPHEFTSQATIAANPAIVTAIRDLVAGDE